MRHYLRFTCCFFNLAKGWKFVPAQVKPCYRVLASLQNHESKSIWPPIWQHCAMQKLTGNINHSFPLLLHSISPFASFSFYSSCLFCSPQPRLCFQIKIIALRTNRRQEGRWQCLCSAPWPSGKTIRGSLTNCDPRGTGAFSLL